MSEMSSAAEDCCEICLKEKSKYKCPKCNMAYCSVSCYKSSTHLACSEQFYKSCVEEELNSKDKSREDMKKICDILKRMHEADAGITGDFANFNDLDSDDEVEQAPSDDETFAEDGFFGESGTQATDEDNNFEEDFDDIAIRLQGVDINNPEEVWQNLTENERLDFQKMLDSGEIMKLIPNYTPWWLAKKCEKIVVLDSKDSKDLVRPAIEKNIQDFNEICKKNPSPCIHFNMWNILTAYTCVVRYFAGEHITSSSEASAHLVNLSTVLKYSENFEDAETAILSVETEALTTGNGKPNAVVTGSLYVENRQQLQEDARQIMLTNDSKLAAFSDILRMFQICRKLMKTTKTKESEFHKLFALSAGSIELNSNKLKQLEKKIEFFLSYIRKQQNESLNF